MLTKEPCSRARLLTYLLAVITLQRRITLNKHEQTVIDYFDLYVIDYFVLYISMKMTSSIAVHHVGTIYHLQWLMLNPFRVSNAFYPTLTCHLSHIVRIFNLL